RTNHGTTIIRDFPLDKRRGGRAVFREFQVPNAKSPTNPQQQNPQSQNHTRPRFRVLEFCIENWFRIGDFGFRILPVGHISDAFAVWPTPRAIAARLPAVRVAWRPAWGQNRRRESVWLGPVGRTGERPGQHPRAVRSGHLRSAGPWRQWPAPRRRGSRSARLSISL